MKKSSYQNIIKDYRLPIPEIEELYPYYFNLYESVYGSKTILETAEKEMQQFDTEEEYFEYIYSVKRNIIDTLKSTSAFCEFNDPKNKDFSTENGNKPTFAKKDCIVPFTSKSNVYNIDNIGKKYISIDLEKANFQVCKKYNKDLVLNSDTYEKLIEKFYNSKYLASSKYLRQIIFGQLAPQRQNSMEKYYTSKILEFLLEKKVFRSSDVVIFTHDEIIVETKSLLLDEFKQIIYDMIYKEFELKTHIDAFSIKRIVNNYFVKEIKGGKIEIKGVPAVYRSQILKKYYNMPITKEDLIFVYEGQKAYFESSIDGQVIL